MHKQVVAGNFGAIPWPRLLANKFLTFYFYNDISVINGKVEFKEIGDFDNLVKNDIVRKKSVVYIYTTDNGKTNVCPEHIQDIINMGINL